MVTEDRVKEVAYGLWEQDGRPDGKDEEHYFKARLVLGELEAVESQPDAEAMEAVAQPAHRRTTRSKKAETKSESTRSKKVETKAESSKAKPAARKRSTRAKKSE